jgi:hypothetical protein
MDDTLYNKYTQFSDKLPTKLPQVHEVKKSDKISKVVDAQTASVLPSIQPPNQPLPATSNEKPMKSNVKTTNATKAVKETKATKETKETKANIIKPLEIILAESCTFESSLDTVKEKLIEFITKKEFSKVFGMTKSADIMSGVVNNRWNKSTALFISFLFNKSVNYNNTMVLYNSEKNNGVIETTT